MSAGSNRRLIQNIFKSQEERLRSESQPLKNLKAITAITRCQTPQNGVSVFRCANGHEEQQYHSCRHRSCFLCAEEARAKWINSYKNKLFDYSHFHVVFTLPHEYLDLWRYNEKWFGQTFFRIVSSLLMEMIGDDRHHGVVPGMLIALHTWGRNLALHPHLHCLVSAGGVTQSKNWKDMGTYLLPIRAVKKLYRLRFQIVIKEAFKSGELELPPDMSESRFWRLYHGAGRKSWSIRIEDRYEHGKGVLLYLARYLKGGPLHPSQIQYVDAVEALVKYKDHREKRVKQGLRNWCVDCCCTCPSRDSIQCGVMDYIRRILRPSVLGTYSNRRP